MFILRPGQSRQAYRGWTRGLQIGCLPQERFPAAGVQKHFEVQDSQERFEENTYTESCSGHGRQELRSYLLSPVPEALQRAAAHWPGLASVVQVVRRRQQAGSEASEEVSYYLSSSDACSALAGNSAVIKVVTFFCVCIIEKEIWSSPKGRAHT